MTMTDLASGVALWRQVADGIERGIADGRFSSGEVSSAQPGKSYDERSIPVSWNRQDPRSLSTVTLWHAVRKCPCFIAAIDEIVIQASLHSQPSARAFHAQGTFLRR